MTTSTSRVPSASSRPPGHTARWQRLPGRGTPIGPFELMAIRRDPVRWLRGQHERYGPVVRSRFLNQKVTLLLGPEANEFVLADPERLFVNRAAWDWFIGAFFPNGLPLRDLADHREHRQLMRSAFTGVALQRYLGLMRPRIEHAVESWPATGRPVVMYPRLKKMTLDLAWDVFVGEPMGEGERAASRAFVDCVRAIGALVRYPIPGGLWWRGLRGRAVLEAYFRQRLRRKREVESDDLFSILCHARDADGTPMDDDDIVDHMIFLMVAAHDTTTIALATMLYYLAFHRDWQERCRREVTELGGGAADLDSLGALELTERVWKESLRLVPPVPALPRVAVRDFEFAGRQVPRDTVVSVSMTYTHHMPEYWTRPERFDPDRFAHGRAEDRGHRFLYLPFGAGAHACIGAHFACFQVKAILCELLARYRLAPARRGYPLRVDRTSLPRPHDDLPLRLEAIR